MSASSYAPGSSPVSALKYSRVAVYGTLKRGHSNFAAYLSEAHFLGEDTLRCICLYDLGDYPGARLERSEGVTVEVFEVDEQLLARLDELEEVDLIDPVQGLYIRTVVDTCFGEAWLYVYNGDIAGCAVIRAGGWSPASGTQLA
jgi:gamma-glutamylcyclotransferase (GGCT)/AIG2-like uncharacterized protein YtfP